LPNGVAFCSCQSRSADGESRLCLSGRFSGYGWRLDVDIDLLGLTATAEKLAAEEEKRGRNDDHKDHQYGHDCGVTAAPPPPLLSAIKSILLVAS
jgi:hypothetical protein